MSIFYHGGIPWVYISLENPYLSNSRIIKLPGNLGKIGTVLLKIWKIAENSGKTTENSTILEIF